MCVCVQLNCETMLSNGQQLTTLPITPRRLPKKKNSSSAQEAPPTKVRKLASDTFLDDDEDDEMDEEEELEVPTKKSEVEEYLLLS